MSSANNISKKTPSAERDDDYKETILTERNAPSVSQKQESDSQEDNPSMEPVSMQASPIYRGPSTPTKAFGKKSYRRARARMDFTSQLAMNRFPAQRLARALQGDPRGRAHHKDGVRPQKTSRRARKKAIQRAQKKKASNRRKRARKMSMAMHVDLSPIPHRAPLRQIQPRTVQTATPVTRPLSDRRPAPLTRMRQRSHSDSEMAGQPQDSSFLAGTNHLMNTAFVSSYLSFNL